MKSYVKSFQSLLDYRLWVNQKFPAAVKETDHESYFSEKEINQLIAEDDNWFGTGTSYRELKEGITTYKDPELIQKLMSQVQEGISTNNTDRIQSRKVRYNASGMGVFSFDRAAMGLYRIQEFYSTKYQRVVDSKEVRQLGDDNFILIKDGSEVVQRQETRPDGNPKVRTSSKYIFAYFPKVKSEKRAVEIFISCGGHAKLTASEFLYSGISAIIIAQMLEKARIKTKINVVVGTSPDQHHREAYACVVPIKNYDETLDINQIALLSSDPRFYRYDGFKGVISIYDHFGSVAPASMGTGFKEPGVLRAVIEASGYLDGSHEATRLYMGRTFGHQESLAEIKNTSQKLAESLNQ